MRAVLVRSSFAIAAVYLIGRCLLEPSWVGRMYHRDPAGSWRQTGIFGLECGEGDRRGFVWNPPRAYSRGFGETVRWPGADVSHSAHVEVDWDAWVTRAGGIVLMLGLLAPISERIGVKRALSPLGRFGLAQAAFCGFGWLIIGCIGLATGWYGLISPVISVILGSTMVLGFVAGVAWALGASFKPRPVAPPG